MKDQGHREKLMLVFRRGEGLKGRKTRRSRWIRSEIKTGKLDPMASSINNQVNANLHNHQSNLLACHDGTGGDGKLVGWGRLVRPTSRYTRTRTVVDEG